MVDNLDSMITTVQFLPCLSGTGYSGKGETKEVEKREELYILGGEGEGGV